VTRLLDVDRLAVRVLPGSSVAVGGALFSRLPMELLRRVAARRPTGLHYVAWGGGLPLEMFLEAGMVSRLSFCFSSLDVFGLAPRFRAALEGGALEVEEWTALGMIQALQAAGQNLPSAAFQPPRGSDLHAHLLAGDPVTRTEVAVAARLDVDTLLIHVQRADAEGNIEIQGARGLDISLIAAARQVLVTAEEIVPRGSLGAPRALVVSRHHVDAVAHAPGGAYPTSCLPYYAADYQALRDAAADPLKPMRPGLRLQRARRAALISPDQVRDALERRPASEPREATTSDVMIHWLARRYEPGSICSAGAVSPLALGSYLLAQQLTQPAPSIITTSGGYWDVGPRPLLFGLGEVLDFASAPVHVGGDETYHDLYQRGRVDYEVVNVAQIDARAATNNLWVTSPTGRRIRLPGQGGMADVADMHANFVLYQTRQSPLSMVERVQASSARRVLHTAAEREAVGYRPGSTEVITDLAVFRLDDGASYLKPVSLHPGVSSAALNEACGFPVAADGLPVTDVPDAAALRLLDRLVDPLGLREVEFVPAAEREALLTAALAREDDLIDEISERAPAPGDQPVHRASNDRVDDDR
jgi:glutaconate CoA-transferase subunit A